MVAPISHLQDEKHHPLTLKVNPFEKGDNAPPEEPDILDQLEEGLLYVGMGAFLLSFAVVGSASLIMGGLSLSHLGLVSILTSFTLVGSGLSFLLSFGFLFSLYSRFHENDATNDFMTELTSNVFLLILEKLREAFPKIDNLTRDFFEDLRRDFSQNLL